MINSSISLILITVLCLSTECYDCDVLSSEYKEGTFGTIFDELMKLVGNVNNCILKTPSDVCNKCLPDFGVVTLAYNKLVGDKGDENVCWDMKDAVSIH